MLVRTADVSTATVITLLHLTQTCRTSSSNRPVVLGAAAAAAEGIEKRESHSGQQKDTVE